MHTLGCVIPIPFLVPSEATEYSRKTQVSSPFVVQSFHPFLCMILKQIIKELDAPGFNNFTKI